jgi:hypothetical protein
VPFLQALPHAPQCWLLVCVLTHWSPQGTAGALHVVTHMPSLHISPASHVLPHSPQWVDVLSGTHGDVAPPQRA